MSDINFYDGGEEFDVYGVEYRTGLRFSLNQDEIDVTLYEGTHYGFISLSITAVKEMVKALQKLIEEKKDE